MQILRTILCTIEKNPYLCIVFFMVLDLRLERCSAVVMTVVHCLKGYLKKMKGQTPRETKPKKREAWC